MRAEARAGASADLGRIPELARCDGAHKFAHAITGTSHVLPAQGALVAQPLWTPHHDVAGGVIR